MIFLILTFSNVFAFDKTTNQIVLCKCKKKIFDTWLEIGIFETMICFFLMHNLHSHYMMKKMSKVTYFFLK